MFNGKSLLGRVYETLELNNSLIITTFFFGSLNIVFLRSFMFHLFWARHYTEFSCSSSVYFPHESNDDEKGRRRSENNNKRIKTIICESG